MRVNSEIKTNSIKIVNLTPIVECTVKEGLQLAQEQGLDLVEVADGNPSICKIMDYQKYLFDKKKYQQKPKKIEIKEIQLGTNIGEHDFQFKLNQAKKFLSEGKKVKTTIFFKGRTITKTDAGEKVMLRFALELEDYGVPENLPKLEGKKMTMIIGFKKK